MSLDNVIPQETDCNPFESDKVLSKGEIEKLSQKIERYIKQSRFSENDKRYIVLLCRQEADHYTETKTGIHLNINKYSGKTLYEVQKYVEKCEETWKLAEEDAINQQEIRKIYRENQTVNFFKKRTEENEENEETKPKSVNRVTTVENNPQNTSMMINFGVDNKKKPLNEYKGIYQRIMRKSRAIKNYKSIENANKKRTTRPILGGIQEHTPEEIYIKEEDQEEEQEDIVEDEYEEEIEDEDEDEDEDDLDNYEDDEEEEEISSLIDEDSDAKYRDSGDEDSSNIEFEDRGDLDALTEKYQ